jgi:3-hydroxyisobutyrate dehydrogenase
VNVGFIGLGDMGLPMVRHLLASGHAVSVWNRSKHKLAPLAELGARIAESPAQLMQGCEVIGLCLTSHHAVEEVCCGAGGLFSEAGSPSAPRPAAIVDFSTGSPEAARQMAALAQARGIGWVDAPVSGGPRAAGTGELTVLAGGEPAALQAASPLLQAVAANVTHLGPSGSGQMAKLCNQLIVACNVLAIAESVALARKAGVDTALLAQALHGGFADSRPLQIFGPRMAAHAFEPRLGAISLMEKDVLLSAQMADALGAVTPMLSAARTLFARARDTREIQPEGDLSQAVLLFEQLADGPTASAPQPSR